MDNLQNAQNSPTATYQLFVKRTLTRKTKNQKLLPVFGCKINLQQNRLHNHPFYLPLSPKQNQSTTSYSVDNELATLRKLPKKDSSYQYYISEIIKRKTTKKFYFDNSLTNSNIIKKQSKHCQIKQQNIELPQIYTPIKIKKQIPLKNIITEPTLIEELQPWESSQKSIPYF